MSITLCIEDFADMQLWKGNQVEKKTKIKQGSQSGI